MTIVLGFYPQMLILSHLTFSNSEGNPTCIDGVDLTSLSLEKNVRESFVRWSEKVREIFLKHSPPPPPKKDLKDSGLEVSGPTNVNY